MFNTEEYLHELSKYVDSMSLLYIDKEGKLRRIYCPFKVTCVIVNYCFVPGEILIVEAVKVTVTLRDVYIISGNAYPIKYFKLIT